MFLPSISGYKRNVGKDNEVFLPFCLLNLIIVVVIDMRASWKTYKNLLLFRMSCEIFFFSFNFFFYKQLFVAEIRQL